MTEARLIACLVLVAGFGAGPARADSENLFGAIHIDGRKAGQIHYTVEYGDGGDVETLRTRASLSILGVKLFNFEQTLHETGITASCAVCAGAPTTTARRTTPCSSAAPAATRPR
jgi:hypothetical protein